jgi:HrpA-like RNA helicase
VLHTLKPERPTVKSALKTLYLVGAIDQTKQLTETGRQMSKYPLEPAHARAILASQAYSPQVTSTVVTIVAILSASSKIFVEPSEPGKRDDAAEARRKFVHPSGDHFTRLNALNSYAEIAHSENKGGRREWARRNFINERTCAEVLNIRGQVRGVCDRVGLKVQWDEVNRASGEELEEGVLRSLTVGYALNAAFLQPDGTYKQILNSTVSGV